MFRLYWKAFRDKAIRYSMNTYRMKKIMLLSPLKIGAVQLRSVTEIASKSLFLCVNRSLIRYGFRAGARAIWYSGNIALASLGIVCYTAVFRVVTQ